MNTSTAENLGSNGILPNGADVAAHLAAMFPPDFAHHYPDALIEIAYGTPGNVNRAELFSVFNLEDAARVAVSKNLSGCNVYVAPSLRKAETCPFARASDIDFLASAWAWTDHDAEGDFDRAKTEAIKRGLGPGVIVDTGTVPHVRAHCYFRISGGITDGDTLRAINKSLRSCLGGDPVEAPSHVMRLAGTINYPTAKKISRGYVVGLVTLQVQQTPTLHQATTLLALSNASGNPGSHRKNGLGFDIPRTDNDLIEILEASRITGAWHRSMRSAIATMVGRGWSDAAIRLACAPYCDGGVGDPDLAPLIDGARLKWDKPNEGTEQKSSSDGNNETGAPPDLRIINPTAWQDEAVPAREWIVQDMIPANTVSLLMGDGAAGKTTLALQLAVARALDRDWIGTLPRAGKTLFLSAEDDESELHRRVDAIRQHYRAEFADLGDLRLIDLVGENAVLGELQRNGIIRATPLLTAVTEQVRIFRPDLVVIDALADAFAGEENNRTQARQFIGLLKRPAKEFNAAILCLAHPSLYGMNSGAGTSGSTGWSNSVRSRLYFEGAKASDDSAPDPDLRKLSVKKINYGPVGNPVTVRWKNGVYVPEGNLNSLDRLALAEKAKNVFLSLLRAFNEQGQNVTATPCSTYAPTVFLKHPKAAGIGKSHLASAMQELLDKKIIRIEVFGPPSKQRQRLVF